MNLQPERLGGDPDRWNDWLVNGICRIQQKAYFGQPGQDLLEQLKSLRCELRIEEGQSSHVTVGSREARHEPRRLSITARRHHNGDRGCSLFRGKDARRPMSDDHVDVATNQFAE